MKYLLLLLLLLAGCATGPNGLMGSIVSPALPPKVLVASTVQAQTTVQRDEFKKLVKFTGPDFSPLPNGQKFSLIGTREDKGAESFLIYVEENHGCGWHFYNSVRDIDGNALNFFKGGSDVNCSGSNYCSFFENSGVGVTRDHLEQHERRTAPKARA